MELDREALVNMSSRRVTQKVMRRCNQALSGYLKGREIGKRGQTCALNKAAVCTLVSDRRFLSSLDCWRRCSLVHALYRNLPAPEVRVISHVRDYGREKKSVPVRPSERHEAQNINKQGKRKTKCSCVS